MLTTEQAATRLKIKVRAVQKLIERGRLPAVKPGRDWEIKEEDVEAFVRLRPGPKGKAVPVDGP